MISTGIRYGNGISVLLGFLLCAPTLVLAASPFVFETVDTAGDNGVATSLALDASGNPHISYYSPSLQTLKYATRNGTTWSIEFPDLVVAVGLNNSIAIDSKDQPHICYYDGIPGNLKYAKKVDGIWSIETVDSSGVVGLHVSIAIDSKDDPHISYSDATNNDLKYATKPFALWNIENVDTTGIVGRSSSLVLDNSDSPHIAYYEETGTDIRYASRIGTGWTLETISTGGDDISLALDAQGVPHVAYEALGLGVRYATKVAGDWAVEAPITTGTLVSSRSLALNANGDPQIAVFANFSLDYLHKTGGSWETFHVDGSGAVGQYAQIVMDESDLPMISYFDFGNTNLKFAEAGIYLDSPSGGEFWPAGSTQSVQWRGIGEITVELSTDGGLTYQLLAGPTASNDINFLVPDVATDKARIRIRREEFPAVVEHPGYITIAPGLVDPWWTELADEGGDRGLSTSLALDGHDSPRISHYDIASGDLVYVSRSGSQWLVELPDTTDDTGQYTSLRLTEEGYPRIAYYDVTEMDLNFAWRDAGSWTIETVDSTGQVGQYASLILDENEEPHISYLDATSGNLKYARKSGSSWSVETADPSGVAGSHCSIDLNSHGDPRISYYDFGSTALKYAARRNGSWTIEFVDEEGDFPGQFTSIEVDASDRPHISYYESCTLCPGGTSLRYAKKTNGSWEIDIVDPSNDAGIFTSIELDPQGNPVISYRAGGSFGSSHLRIAAMQGGEWFIRVVDTDGDVGQYNSLALDSEGNARISYRDATNHALKYASSAIETGEPGPGLVWPVGSTRTITWDGNGPVDLFLSIDGGASFDLLAKGLNGGGYQITVPHSPTKFAKFKMERTVPRSVAISNEFFEIRTEISLLTLKVEPLLETQSGAIISWQTEPGPEDLLGYRLDRSEGNSWGTIVSLTQETSYHDAAGAAGNRYRLFAINGLGQPFMLGEASFLSAAPLAAWPLPVRTDGLLNISFAVASALGGGAGNVEVLLFDARGRLVRTIVRGEYNPGYSTVRWDGLDESGRSVPAGLYFLQARSGGDVNNLKVVVLK